MESWRAPLASIMPSSAGQLDRNPPSCTERPRGKRDFVNVSVGAFPSKENNNLKPCTRMGSDKEARLKNTLMATLIASVAGTGAWLFGLSRTVWPAHPMLATFIVTLVAYAAVKLSWPSSISESRRDNAKSAGPPKA